MNCIRHEKAKPAEEASEAEPPLDKAKWIEEQKKEMEKQKMGLEESATGESTTPEHESAE